MVPIERRRLLQGAALSLTGLAGCGGQTTSSSTATGGSSRVEPSDATVPAHVSLRAADTSYPVWLPDEDPSPTATATETVSNGHRDWHLVGSRETADRLRFAAVDGVEAARSFVADTDFESETLLVESERVAACYDLSLCNVSWTENGVDTAYGSVLRDADVVCEADAREGVSMLIRIPAALDPAKVRGSSSSWSSAPCYGGRRDDGAATTDQPRYGPATAGNVTDSETATSQSSPTTTEGGQ